MKFEPQSIYPRSQYHWVRIPKTGKHVAYVILKINLSTESVKSTISVNDSSMTNSSVYSVKPAANFVSKNSNLMQAAHENSQANTCHHEIKASRGQQQQPEQYNSTYGERIFSFDEELCEEQSDRELDEMSKFIFNLVWV